jgi:hypothetical protein
MFIGEPNCASAVFYFARPDPDLWITFFCAMQSATV